jgi:hypothetical protein
MVCFHACPYRGYSAVLMFWMPLITAIAMMMQAEDSQ